MKLRLSLIVVVIALLVFFVSTALSATPKPEGTLVVGLFSLAEEGFLPDRCSGTASPLWEPVYDFLIYGNSVNMKPIPGLAERWEYSKDYKTLTFHLRKGVQFHDGWGELTAEDVKFTIELNARPTSTNLRSSDLRKIASMEVRDRYTLALHLKEPDPMLWLSFSTADNTGLGILCKKYVETIGEEKANRQPLGSGPYRFVEQKSGDYAKFEAYDSHWLVVPEFKYLVIRIVPEESTRVAMLKTGELDIAMELGMNKIPELEKTGLRTIVQRNTVTDFIALGGLLIPEDKRYVEGYHRKDPWKDVRVREAMNIAIDRAAVAKDLFHNFAVPAPIALMLPGWDKLPPIPYDPKRAKQLLAQAGYPNGFSFKLLTHDKEPMLPLLAQAVVGYWEAIGLRGEIVPGDYATWRDTNKTGKTAGWLWTHTLGDFPDWSERLMSYEMPNASTPLWEGEETKSLVRKTLAEMDLKKRDADFRDLAKAYRAAYTHIPLVYVARLHSVSPKVGQWSPGHQLYPKNFVFARHAKPLNTPRLFTP
ncbi:MAG TPA: ABC transporter substrate-binding protein [Syntrophorhabdaceae bacterium]|nr:ABC transporter substrate-binding protein [Syntrophorhabdaceae bacterium]